MENNGNQITLEEAQLTLESLETLKRDAIISMRPTLWLNLVSSLLFGVFIVSMALARHENTWFLVTIISMIAFVSTFFIWFRKLHIKGMTPKYFPSSTMGKIIRIAQNLIYLLSILALRELHIRGFTWAPYVGASVICMAYSFWWHNFPTDEWAKRRNDL